jgi:hypothetical protein
MYYEIIASVLASLGGASIIVATFANFLGKIWTKRIEQSQEFKFKTQIEEIKSKNDQDLESLKSRYNSAIKESELYSTISQEFYQAFFKERIDVYLKLLEIRNKYITDIQENIITEIQENWGAIYSRTYSSLRKLIIEKQLYISNELEDVFHQFRNVAAEYLKEADMADMNFDRDNNPPWDNEQLAVVNDKFAQETNDHMVMVFNTIDKDIKKIRSRIDIDRV